MIKIKQLRFGYRHGQKLFDNLDLKMEAGSIYGLFGMNGAGKSTLFRQICGLLYSQGGSCEVLGFQSSERKPEMLRDIFLVPEDYDLPAISIREYVKVHAPFYPSFDLGMFEKFLNEFDVDASQKLNNLSYGQKKKFLISFGLATQTKILLMDEPTNGLDIPSKSQFRRIMASSVSEDRCVIISTHQVRDLVSIIDYITILEKGKIIFHHNAFEVSEKLSFGFVGDGADHQILYSEEVLGGRKAILKKNGKDSEIDMELLFNAVISSPSVIENEFKS